MKFFLELDKKKPYRIEEIFIQFCMILMKMLSSPYEIDEKLHTVEE